VRWNIQNPWSPIMLTLSFVLIGILIFDSYNSGTQMALSLELAALRIPATALSHEHIAGNTKQSGIHNTLLRVYNQIVQAHIPITGVGIHTIHNHRHIAGFYGSTSDDRLANLQLATWIGRSEALLPLSSRARTNHNGAASYIALFPSGSANNRTVIFFTLPGLTVDQQQWVLLEHHATLIVVLISIVVIVLTNRLFIYFRYLSKPPTDMANWVKALVMDPFTSPPSSVELMDPLTQVILQMRSRVYLQESLFNSLFISAPLGMIHLSLDFRVQMINDAMTELIGLQAEHVTQTSISEIQQLLSVELQPFPISISRLKHGESIRHLNVELTHYISKERKYATISIIPNLVGPKDAFGYTIFAEDITNKRQWELYNERNDRLNLIAELAASTAHEIRNPLTTVRGFLQLQRKRTIPQPGRDHFQIMIEEIDRVDSLISEYLTLAHQNVSADFEPTALADILHHLIPLVTAEANMKGIVVSVLELPEAYCLGNKQELKQVFLNLMKNAIDAMNSGGQLTVYGTLTATAYTVAIRDTGTGIPPERISHIFEPFYTTKSSGSGLGLAVTKKIVESHQGEIEVDSVPDIGTTFYVTFPV